MADQVELVIPASLDGERVDKAVSRLLDLSRAQGSTLVDRGVEVDGNPVIASDRVREGQVLVCSRPAAPESLEAEKVHFDVLFEDDDVIVVNKPAGIVVHPGSGRSRGTLAAGLMFRYPELVGVGGADRWGLVHRLDMDTSGALMVGRNQSSYENLVAQLRRRELGRVYTTLVEGRMAAPTGAIEAPIGRDPSQPTRRAVSHVGKHARTHYELLCFYGGHDVSLLEVKLDTGRTHQIRVHMSAISHPVVGDIAYGATRKDIGAPRTFLHASRIQFAHPASGEEVSVEAPLPPDLSDVLARLDAGSQ